MKFNQLLIASVIALLAVSANAGLIQPAPVDVDLENSTASGDMVNARFSRNDTVFIGCGTRHVANGDGTVTSFGFCQAEDDQGETFTCFSFDEELVARMSNGDDYSFITFNWNENDECVRVGFSTQSFYMPLHVRGRTNAGQ